MTSPDLDLPDLRSGSVQEWRAVADGLLSPPCCAFHRNTEISAHYAWLHAQLPTCFKWAAMAAIASHHVRRALFPFRRDADGSGHVDIARSLGRRGRLTEDANTVREANNAIFHDIFWVHLAYVGSEDPMASLRRLLAPDPHYAGALAAFESIDRGRAALALPDADERSRRDAEDLVWAGNLALLEHEQRAVVQPHFDRLSASFARLVSMGATTSFEARGARREVRYFTSFYLYSLTGGLPGTVRARGLPRITRYDDRWRWLETSVVPRFRRFDAEPGLVGASLARVTEDARRYADSPCVDPG